MYTIHHSKKLTNLSPVKYKIINLFINFCVNKLKIHTDFNVYLTDKNDNLGFNMTLACYDVNSNNIYCRTDSRFFYDVCRSIAHELVHLKQNQNNEIDWKKFTDVGGIWEDEANSVAGVLCKEFTYENNCRWIYKL